MKIVHWLDDHLEELCLTLLLIGISAIMVTQVIARYVFNYSLSWSDELARYCLVWSAFLSVSFCVKKRISIKIDQVQNALPARAIPWLKMLRHTIVFLFCILMIPYAWTYVQQSVSSGASSPALQIPMVFIQCAPLVGFILLAIRVSQAWLREFKVSRTIMAETIVDALKAEPLEEMKEEERQEELRRKQEKGGEDS